MVPRNGDNRLISNSELSVSKKDRFVFYTGRDGYVSSCNGNEYSKSFKPINVAGGKFSDITTGLFLTLSLSFGATKVAFSWQRVAFKKTLKLRAFIAG